MSAGKVIAAVVVGWAGAGLVLRSRAPASPTMDAAGRPVGRVADPVWLSILKSGGPGLIGAQAVAYAWNNYGPVSAETQARVDAAKVANMQNRARLGPSGQSWVVRSAR